MNVRNISGVILFIIMMGVILSACSSSTSSTAFREEAKEDYDYEPTSTDELDHDDPETEEIIQGKELLYETDTALEDYTGNDLSCMSCHASDNLSGTQPLEGVTENYPKYRERDAAVADMKDRVNGCMNRSMNGKDLPRDSEEMDSIVAYLEYISEDFEGEDPDDFPWLEDSDMEEVPEPDVDHGEYLFEEKNCMTCHGNEGEGDGANEGPALWGDGSFNDGAGMSRLSKISGFIQKYMPKNDAGSLSDQEAADIASYLLSLDRPEWDGHEDDWPEGGRPDDIITKDEREEIQNGTFDWSELDVVK